MSKEHGPQQRHMREQIAQLAARLIAEDGVHDYALAKRKAARQLGAPATHNLPANAEVEQALRSYQAIYQKDEQDQRLRLLRQQALEAMRLLTPFNPHLTGAVLNGTAPRHSDIHLQLFADSSKEVEMFLLNRKIPYRCGHKRFRIGDERVQVPAFTLQGDPARIEIAVFATGDLRKTPTHPIDGKPLERAKIAEVEALLALADINVSRKTPHFDWP
jgi:hypothetical protein